MIIANFKNDSYPIAHGATQWNYGEVLRIQGLILPKAVEIHFSLDRTCGQSVTRIGTTKDGVTDVVIPDSLLENEGALQDYFVYVWIYLTDATSGRTEHSLSIKVKARSKPEIPGGDDNADPFREAIEEVNSAAERAESAEKQAGEYAEQTKANAQQTTADRQEVKKLVDSVSGIGEQVQAVKEYKEQAQTATTNAMLSEQKSEQAKEAALQAGAETVADEVEQHALEVAGDKTEVERLATQVRQDKSSVEQTAQGFGNTVQQAEQSINTAKTKAVEAVQTEGTKQTGNVTAEGAKQVQAVQAKGQQILDSITEIQVNNPSTTYTLQPNIQVVWNEVAELNLTLAPEKPNAINIYPFWFTSGATPTKVTLPATIILDNFVTKANKKYCCQIEQNVLFWKEFEVVA